MAHVEGAHPENDVFGDVGGMVGDALEGSRGENELHARTDQCCLLGHGREQILEDAIAVLVHHVVAFEDLRGHFDVAKDERAEALADHRANGPSHRGKLFRNRRARHLAKGDRTLREVDSEVADTLEVVGYFQGGDDEAHLVVRKGAAAEQAYGVLIEYDFHFVDARLEKKYFAGKSGRARAVLRDKSVKGTIHRSLDRAGH